MLHGIASGGVTVNEYPLPYPLTGSSSKQEMDTSEIMDQFFFILRRQKWQELLKRPVFDFYRSLLLTFEIDLSSVHPRFEPMTGASLIGEFGETILPEEILEYDIIVRMSPRRRYTIELEVESIKKAEPRIIEPEWI